MTELELQHLLHAINRRSALMEQLIAELQEQRRLILDDIRRAIADQGVRERTPALYRPLPPPAYLAIDTKERERKYRDYLDRFGKAS
jgi:hypothetical protein